MQRYGPPPSYPNLKIPGVNCAVPEGGHYGLMFQRPLDESGKPIMGGNIYGTMRTTDYDDESAPVGNLSIILQNKTLTLLDKTLWGEVIEEEYPEEQVPMDIVENIEHRTESETISGISSLISGMQTPEIDIRKQTVSNASKITSQQVQNINYHESAPKTLYQVLEPIQVILIFMN